MAAQRGPTNYRRRAQWMRFGVPAGVLLVALVLVAWDIMSS